MVKIAFITGIGGQDGSYLSELLLKIDMFGVFFADHLLLIPQN